MSYDFLCKEFLSQSFIKNREGRKVIFLMLVFCIHCVCYGSLCKEFLPQSFIKDREGHKVVFFDVNTLRSLRVL